MRKYLTNGQLAQCIVHHTLGDVVGFLSLRDEPDRRIKDSLQLTQMKVFEKRTAT